MSIASNFILSLICIYIFGMTSYLNAIYGIETVRMVVILKDVNIDVYDTLYAPFYNLSGEF